LGLPRAHPFVARALDAQLDFDPVLSVAYPLLADGTGVSAAGKRGDASVRLPIALTAYIEHETQRGNLIAPLVS
jgi:hypothetical protein